MENKNIYNVKMPEEARYMGSGWGKWVEIPQLIAKRWREFPLFELRFSPIFRQIKNRRICFGHDT